MLFLMGTDLTGLTPLFSASKSLTILIVNDFSQTDQGKKETPPERGFF